ncbi:phage portal protein [Defluviimonas sp. WL0002]|uniref:Phage portal protein n=1 Tax=Albidovulum marisflavi TaxID=2984159 RepID=A0ABT2ZHP9_9RHOB|nr:phage portal protein [Defluviimonas sp. WL0002]MCV2870642.1 phage portal protein [Defluviimonas sp. WL0002]
MTERIPFGFVERLIEPFSPSLARKRLSQRVALDFLRRGYDGAARGRGTQGWTATGSSADAEVSVAGPALRARMRDLVRNDPMAAQAVQVLVNNIVGPGIRPRAKTGNKRTDKRVNELFRRFAATCDWHGHTDFYGLQALAVREMIEGGECLGIQRFMPRGSGKDVPLKIELREADHLDDGLRGYGVTGPRIDMGIEYDAAGRRVAYHMFPDHPGGTSNVFGNRLKSERIPADRVVHLFERQRVQNRGVPWGVSAMRGLRDFGDWHRAEMVRKKTEACLVGVVIGEDAGAETVAPSMKDAAGNKVEEFSPGMVAYTAGAQSIEFSQPAAAGGVAEWSRTQLMIIAAGFRVPYALMTGDFSQSNFSSNRAGLNEFRRMVDQLQWQCIIPMLCQPIWDWFILAARTQGLLPEGDGPIGVEWAPPRFESVNPKQDADADLAEVRAGFSTRSQKIAARGYDPEEVLDEWRKDAEAADAALLVFDSDPRRVAKAGSAQPETKPVGAADTVTE